MCPFIQQTSIEHCVISQEIQGWVKQTRSLLPPQESFKRQSPPHFSSMAFLENRPHHSHERGQDTLHHIQVIEPESDSRSRGSQVAGWSETNHILSLWRIGTKRHSDYMHSRQKIVMLYYLLHLLKSQKWPWFPPFLSLDIHQKKPPCVSNKVQAMSSDRPGYESYFLCLLTRTPWTSSFPFNFIVDIFK